MSPLAPDHGTPLTCKECGFGVPAGSEYCPDCGVSQSSAMWRRLRGRPPRIGRCLQVQQQQIQAKLDTVEQEILHFERQRARVSARLQQVRAAGRDELPLSQSQALLGTALSDRRQLRSRYQALAWEIEMDRLEGRFRARAAQLEQQRSARQYARRLACQPWPLATMAGHSGRVEALAFQPRGHLLASVGRDHRLVLWDCRTHQEVFCLELQPTERSRRLLFSPGGRYLAVAQPGLVTLTDGRRLLATLATSRIRQLAFRPGGRGLAYLKAGQVRLWTPEQPRGRLRAGGASPVCCLAFTPDGEGLVLGGADGELWLVDPDSDAEPELLDRQDQVVDWVQLDPAGRALAYGAGGELRLLDLEGRVETARLSLGLDEQHLVRISPDQRYLLACQARGRQQQLELTFWVWDLSQAQQLASWSHASAGVLDLALGPGGQLVALSEQEEITLLDVERGAALERFSTATPASVCALDHGGGRLALGQGQSVQLHLLYSRELLRLSDELDLQQRVQARLASPRTSEERQLLARLPDRAARSVQGRVALLLQWAEELRLISHSEQRGRQASAQPASRLQQLLLAAAQLHQVSLAYPHSAHHAGSRSQLQARLAHTALAPAVNELLGQVEAQCDGLAAADELDCQQRMSSMEQQERQGRQLLELAQGLPPSVLARRSLARLLRTLRELVEQLPGLQDLVLVRQAAAAAGQVSPIQDDAAQQLALDREALQLGHGTHGADVPLSSTPAPLQELLQERHDVLRSIEQEHQRLLAEASAAAEVERLTE